MLFFISINLWAYELSCKEEEKLIIVRTFEKAFLNFCINYALKNKDKLQAIDLKFLEKYETFGIIKDNSIDFTYQKKSFKP